MNSRRSRVCLLTSLVTLAVAGPVKATTEPETTVFDRIQLTDEKIVLPHPHVVVGTLVVFIVQNKSSHMRNIHVGSYRSAYFAPGKTIRFELSFPVPWKFAITSVSREQHHLLRTSFVCSF